MLAESFAKQTHELSPSFDLRPGQRLAMVSLAYVPLLHATFCVTTTLAITNRAGLGWAIFSGILTLYLVPPLAVFAFRPRVFQPEVPIAVGTSEFFRWWYTTQWQVLFNRFPQLEEVLRIVPGLYSLWLRLWGAKVGQLVYWSPGLEFFDRPYITVGDRVVIGAGTRISPHFLARGPSGHTELVLAPIQIGDDTLIGGSTLLPAGVCVCPREQTPGGRPIAPFSRFENGQCKRTHRFYRFTNNEA